MKTLISIINKSQIKNVSFILSPHPNTFNETLKNLKIILIIILYLIKINHL